jgi:hypothetical protein
VPQATSAPTDRAIALACIQGAVSERKTDTPAMAASVMLAHLRSIRHPANVCFGWKTDITGSASERAERR